MEKSAACIRCLPSREDGPKGLFTGHTIQPRPPLVSGYFRTKQIKLFRYFSADATEKALIEKALKEIENATCISFKPRTTEAAYVNVKNDEDGCWAGLGYSGGKVDLNMWNNCFGDVLIKLLVAFYPNRTVSDLNYDPRNDACFGTRTRAI
jgi:hypothetical protein